MKKTLWCVIALLAAQGIASAEGGSEPPQRAEAAADVSQLMVSVRQLLAESKWAEAIALIDKLLKLDPGNQEAAFSLSAAYIASGKVDDALPLLEKLAKDIPDNPSVKNNLAWAYVKTSNPATRNPEKAVSLARDAVLVMPSNDSMWNTLAEAYYACGQYDRAQRAAESALRLATLAGVTNTTEYSAMLARCKQAAGKEKTAKP